VKRRSEPIWPPRFRCACGSDEYRPLHVAEYSRCRRFGAMVNGVNRPVCHDCMCGIHKHHEAPKRRRTRRKKRFAKKEPSNG